MYCIFMQHKTSSSALPISHGYWGRPFSWCYVRCFSWLSKRRITSAKLKLQFLFLNHILKWKDCQVDPLGHCFRSSLRGINSLRGLGIWVMGKGSKHQYSRYNHIFYTLCVFKKSDWQKCSQNWTWRRGAWKFSWFYDYCLPTRLLTIASWFHHMKIYA